MTALVPKTTSYIVIVEQADNNLSADVPVSTYTFIRCRGIVAVGIVVENTTTTK
ncbi:hypothetical protein [Nostoc sp.]|uniref:hypothetical protein n=1 Tax=Nostoc sp. TaxID=1180 RepID=UPI002FF8A03D